MDCKNTKINKDKHDNVFIDKQQIEEYKNEVKKVNDNLQFFNNYKKEMCDKVEALEKLQFRSEEDRYVFEALPLSDRQKYELLIDMFGCDDHKNDETKSPI